MIILGASGDLTGRYLLPALAELDAADLLEGALKVIGVGRERWTTEEFRRHAEQRLTRHAPHVARGGREALLARMDYLSADVTDPTTLAPAIDPSTGPVVAYLALPPAVFASTIRALGTAGLPPGSRIVVEKPFGTDLRSARALNELLHRYLGEDAVFRMDHFLGMQTVQNLIGLRFANRVFEPLWCAEHVAGIEVIWDETVALEGRAGYYDHTGALRDMIQNHLLQLLALVAMECPESLHARELRDRKVAALRAVRWGTGNRSDDNRSDDNRSDDNRNDGGRSTTETAEVGVRARYTAGSINGHRIPSYTDEPGIDPSRGTETYAEVTLFVDHERWRGVPFRLRTGKALARDCREIRLHFRPVDRLPFLASAPPQPNSLVLRIDPDQMRLNIVLNGAGDPFDLEPARLELDLAQQDLSAYARLLLDAFAGDPVLSIRADEVEESWRIVEPILAAWDGGAAPLLTYPAGSTGP